MNIKLANNEDLTITTKSGYTVTVPNAAGTLYQKPNGGIPVSDTRFVRFIEIDQNGELVGCDAEGVYDLFPDMNVYFIGDYIQQIILDEVITYSGEALAPIPIINVAIDDDGEEPVYIFTGVLTSSDGYLYEVIFYFDNDSTLDHYELVCIGPDTSLTTAEIDTIWNSAV